MERVEITGRIRKATGALSAEVLRELSQEDILVREVTKVEVKNPGLKNLRALHHKLAQVLAMGFSDVEASAATGYTPNRISILKGDPAFKELLSFYGEERKEVFIDVQGRMAGFATTAVEVLQERIEDSPESFSNKDLNSLIKTTADRGGHSPVHKTENKTVILTAQELRELKIEVEDKQNGQVRRINQEEETRRVKVLLEGQRDQGVQDSEGTEKCEANLGPACIVLEASEIARVEGKGFDV